MLYHLGLADIGIVAIDVGHIDIEYMWMLMDAKGKCAIPGKNVNEVGQNLDANECTDIEYLKSIIVSVE